MVFSNENVEDSSSQIFSQPMSEKLKASNFPADLLNIGTWKRVSKYEVDIVAKCYYAKRKLVWEVLDCGLKSKIEIQWSDISAIKANLHKNGPQVLEIELSQPPMFFRETNPQPRKHTLWKTAADFTGGQALTYRRHYLEFPEGTLEKHYLKLLNCDERLYVLSQRPFPSLSSPYFASHDEYGGCHDEYGGYMYDLSSCTLGDQSVCDRTFEESLPLQLSHYDTMKSTAVPSWQIPKLKFPGMSSIDSIDSTSLCSVADFHQEEGVGQQFECQKSWFWEDAPPQNQEEIVIGNGDLIEGLPMSAFANQIIPSLAQQVDGEGMFASNNWALHATAEDMLNDQIYQQNALAEGNSMHSLVDTPMQLYSAVENTDNGYEQFYDSTVQLPVQYPIEQILEHLPQGPTYPYLLPDQAQEDLACNGSYIPWY